MDIPARPNKSSNPWYEAREAYDQALEDAINQVDRKVALPARGMIPDGSDLDDFYGPDYKGVWWFSGPTQMENTPFVSATSGVLEIISEGPTGTNATKQVFTNQNLSYWREANTATQGLWGDWHKYVSNQDLEDGLNEVASNAIPKSVGVISEPTDLNTLIEYEHVGPSLGRLEYILNGPEELSEISGNPLVYIFVGRSASNGFYQQVMYGSSHPRIWTRLSVIDNVFGPWSRHITSDDTLTTNDRYEFPTENQTYNLTNPKVYAYNFDRFAGSVSRLPPDVGRVWTRNSDETLLSGRGISQVGGTNSTLILEPSENFSDGDILVRMSRGIVGSFASSLMARTHLSSDNNVQGYMASLVEVSGRNQVGIGVRTDSGSTTLARQIVDIDAYDVFYLRFNLRGPRLRAKAWLEGDIEPEDWQVETQDSRFSSGYVGFRSATSSTAWDVLSINEAGGMAV